MTGGFKFFYFHPDREGIMIQLDEHIFSNELVKSHQLEKDLEK